MTDMTIQEAIEIVEKTYGKQYASGCGKPNLRLLHEEALLIVLDAAEEKELWKHKALSENKTNATAVLSELEQQRKNAEYITRLKAEKDELHKALLHEQELLYDALKDLETAKSEAQKEFAERLKAKCDEIIKDDWNKRTSPVSWSDAYESFIDDIDHLLKEMG